MFKFNSFLALLLCFIHQTAHSLQLEQVSELPGVVWSIESVDDEHLIFTLREGRAGILDIESKTVDWVEGLQAVFAKGQGGLMDVARHQDWYYWTYSKASANDPDEGVTVLARARLKGQQLTDWQDLLITQSETDTGRHFGSRIAFDDQGHVFFGVGDRGHRPNGQDLSTHAGSILRLNLDGSTPSDNPFVKTANALPEIWSYGHRNPQGLCFDEQQRLWSSEHGPRGGDEINLIVKGENYGWAKVSHGKEYWGPLDVGEAKTLPGMQDPKQLYIPSIAPASLLCYRGNNIPEFKSSLLLGALKLTHLNSVTIKPDNQLVNEQRWFEDQNHRIRALHQSPDGQLWMATDAGKLLKVIP